MCGIFGVHGHPEAANLTYLGLHALQHRGQEAAGIVSSDGTRLHAQRAMGLVADIFGSRTLEKLPGRAAIGHVRYATAGGSELRNAQPLAVDYAHGGIAVAHNGNLVNAGELRARLEAAGSIFASSSDTEVIVHLIAHARESDTVERIVSACARCRAPFR
jgi:amidophosphoribosyltransferase